MSLKLVCFHFNGNLAFFFFFPLDPWFLLFHTAKCSGTKLILEN